MQMQTSFKLMKMRLIFLRKCEGRELRWSVRENSSRALKAKFRRRTRRTKVVPICTEVNSWT